MTPEMRNLIRGRDQAWPSLKPAYDHAIALAREAEYLARHTSDLAMTGIDPVYPVIVQMLADAGAES